MPWKDYSARCCAQTPFRGGRHLARHTVSTHRVELVEPIVDLSVYDAFLREEVAHVA